MTAPPDVGDLVQTALGRGVVREVRRNGRVVVLIGSRAVVVEAASVVAVEPPRKASKRRRPAAPDARESSDDDIDSRRQAPAELDLHGLTVDEALERTATAINDALLANRARLRLIHGRSGGRIKAALRRYLRGLPSVRAFRIDPSNGGVTIVDL